MCVVELRLNWTKVGLKVDIERDAGIARGRLNWTKVGLKDIALLIQVN